MGNQKKFLQHLQDILLENEFQEFIKWSEDGFQIVMISPNDFEEKVMPLYFNSTKVSTFYRQLNQYGFQFKQNEKKEKVFWHPQFKKNSIVSLKQLERKKRNDDIQKKDDFHKENKALGTKLKLLQKNQEIILAQLTIHSQIYNIIQKQMKSIYDYQKQDEDGEECLFFFNAIIDVFKGFKSDIAQNIFEDLKQIGGPLSPQLSPLLFPFYK